MKKHGRLTPPPVTSKYFSIDSYFKSAPPNKKMKPSSSSEEEIPVIASKKEQCPSCQAFIQVESVSMQVHVNACLDSQHQENQVPNVAAKNVVVDNKPARIIPSSWKSIFSASASTSGLPLEMKNVNTTTMKSSKRKPCPFYKRVRDTKFVVDAFNYGKILNCDGYFLTHYHSDHFGGLRSNWNHGPIYCSEITANLVKQELKVNSKYIHAIPMNELYPIPNSNNTSICFMDANHCPGSVLILFILKNGVRHLHTGDFRATPKMCLHPFVKNTSIHCLYLDTTYLNPKYSFPAQEECIEAICELIHKEVLPSNVLDNWIIKVDNPMIHNKSRVLIVVGTYTIGKERVFFNIAKMLKCKIYAPLKKKKILSCLQDKELLEMLTNNPLEAQVHIVSLRELKKDEMSNYLNKYKTQFDRLIGIKPTGWTYKTTTVQQKQSPLSEIIIPPIDRSISLLPFYDNNQIKLFGIPYSEHSSFRELASFIASLDIKQIIPTVNLNQLSEMNSLFDNWNQDKTSKRIELVKYTNENYW